MGVIADKMNKAFDDYEKSKDIYELAHRLVEIADRSIQSAHHREIADSTIRERQLKNLLRKSLDGLAWPELMERLHLRYRYGCGLCAGCTKNDCWGRGELARILREHIKKAKPKTRGKLEALLATIELS